MPAVVFALAIAAVIAAVIVSPTNTAVEQTRIREALGQWSLALQEYRAAHCQESISRITEANLIEDDYLSGWLHDEIEFSAVITANGRARSSAIVRQGKPSNAITKAWVATQGTIVAIDGVQTLFFSTNSFSQGAAPPGFLSLLSFDQKAKECKQ